MNSGKGSMPRALASPASTGMIAVAAAVLLVSSPLNTIATAITPTISATGTDPSPDTHCAIGASAPEAVSAAARLKPPPNSSRMSQGMPRAVFQSSRRSPSSPCAGSTNSSSAPINAITPSSRPGRPNQATSCGRSTQPRATSRNTAPVRCSAALAAPSRARWARSCASPPAKPAAGRRKAPKHNQSHASGSSSRITGTPTRIHPSIVRSMP